MSTWKKVLVKGLDLTGTDVINNAGDVAAGVGISVTGNTANSLLGDGNTDLTIAVDIPNQTLLNATAANDDELLIYDTDPGALKRISVSNLAGAFSSDVTSVQLTADGSTNTGTADVGGVVFNIEGGVGITTTGSDGNIKIDGDDATDSTKGIASFASADFTVSSGAVVIAEGGVSNAQLAGSIAADKLAGSIGDTLLNEIATADKVNITALNIDGASHNNSTLQTGDVFPVVNVNGGDGGVAINGKTTIDAINTYVGSNAASTATVHTDITGAADITGTGIQFVSALVMDTYGHVTTATLTDLPAAASGVAGILNNGDVSQTITGQKTFEDNITMSSNLTVTGDLQVDGTTTTVNSTEVNIADTQIVLGVPDTAYAVSAGGVSSANSAADNNGIVVASHHASTGTDDAETDAQIIAKYAGVRWRTGGELTGWVVNDTATAHEPGEGVAYDATAEDEGDQFAIAIMDFMTDADTPPSSASAGVGSFMINTTDEELYIRVA